MSIAARIPLSGIRVMMELAATRPDAIDLSVGEPDFDTPAHIVEAAHRAALDGRTRYTSSAGIPALREAIADRATADWGRQVAPEQAIVTTGAVGALAAAVLAVVEPGDEVLVPDPGWPNYGSIVLLAQAIPVAYALRPDTAFEPDLDEIERLVGPRTAAIIMSTPGNPTGATWRRETVDAVAELARRRGIRVISDEVYEAFAFDRPHAPAALEHDDVISISGCSKTYAMTGWRVGFAIAPSADISLMTRVQEPLVSCASSVSQAAALAALTGPQDVVAQMRDAYRRRRDIVTGILEPHGLLAARPTGAFYALVDLRSTGLRGFDAARAVLDHAGVVSVAGDSFGAVADGMVRISFAAADDLVERACRSIAEFALAAVGKGRP